MRARGRGARARPRRRSRSGFVRRLRSPCRCAASDAFRVEVHGHVALDVEQDTGRSRAPSARRARRRRSRSRSPRRAPSRAAEARAAPLRAERRQRDRGVGAQRCDRDLERRVAVRDRATVAYGERDRLRARPQPHVERRRDAAAGNQHLPPRGRVTVAREADDREPRPRELVRALPVRRRSAVALHLHRDARERAARRRRRKPRPRRSPDAARRRRPASTPAPSGRRARCGRGGTRSGPCCHDGAATRGRSPRRGRRGSRSLPTCSRPLLPRPPEAEPVLQIGVVAVVEVDAVGAGLALLRLGRPTRGRRR